MNLKFLKLGNKGKISADLGYLEIHDRMGAGEGPAQRDRKKYKMKEERGNRQSLERASLKMYRCYYMMRII